MSGEVGKSTASRGPTSGSPLDPTGRELKVRIWLGALLVVIGTYLLGDTAARFQLAWHALSTWWPWLLLAVAVANVLRSVLRPESLLAPGLLAFVALGALGFRNGMAGRTWVDLVIPMAVGLVGMVLLLSAGAWLSRSWTRVLVTGRVVASGQEDRLPTARAFLGELKVDLCPLTAPPREVLVTAVVGHVHLTVPAEWRLELQADGALLTPIRGSAGGGQPVKLRVLGFCGVVSVARAVSVVS